MTINIKKNVLFIRLGEKVALYVGKPVNNKTMKMKPRLTKFIKLYSYRISRPSMSSIIILYNCPDEFTNFL